MFYSFSKQRVPTTALYNTWLIENCHASKWYLKWFLRYRKTWRSSCDDLRWQQGKSCIYSWQLWPSFTWWRHQIETFSALLTICTGNSPVPSEFPAQRPVTRSFDIFSDLRLNKRLSKQWWGWWFEALSRPLWRHRNNRLWKYDCIRWICWNMLHLRCQLFHTGQWGFCEAVFGSSDLKSINYCFTSTEHAVGFMASDIPSTIVNQ